LPAAIHAIDPGPIRGHLPTHLTRRDHAVARVSGLQKLDELEARDSEAWILEHVPLDTPAALLQRSVLLSIQLSIESDIIRHREG
jgi:hypothetical protein